MKVSGKTYNARNPAHVIRDAEMVLMYRDGKTLAEIGKQYGVTREYVRQQLAKMGLSSMDGGMTMRSLSRIDREVKRKADAKARRERRDFETWGATTDEIAAMSTLKRSAPRHPIRLFAYQRNVAKFRGIAWNLTLGEWWRIWQESGHWNERGRGDGYCMARWGDSDGYAPGNVYITTSKDNIRHYQDAKRGGYRQDSTKVATGVYLLYPGLAKPYVALLGGKKKGHFATVEEAIAARATSQHFKRSQAHAETPAASAPSAP